MKLIKKAGTLSFHCREREVVVALWSQPHAFPSSLRRMTLPGRSSRTLPYGRGPCTSSLLGPGRTHTFNYTSRPPLSTLWFLRPWRVWDICDSLTHSPLHFYPLCLCLCSAHRIVAPILIVKDNEQNTAGRGEQNRLLTLTIRIFHTKFAHLNVKLPFWTCRREVPLHYISQLLTRSQTALKYAYFKPNVFWIRHSKIAFLLFLANPCEHASSLHHCSEISMALLFTHDFDFILRNFFDGPPLLHERFNFEKISMGLLFTM